MDMPAVLERFDIWRNGEPDDVQERVESPPESLFVTASAITAGVVTRRTLKAAWQRVRGTEPPTNPVAPGVSWSDALIWAAAVGAAAGVARVLSRRGATAAVRRISDR